MTEPISKICTRCGQNVPLDGFYRHPKGKFGRASLCKPCFTERYSTPMDERRKTEEGRKRLRILRRQRPVSDEARARERRSAARYSEKYPEKERAKRLVRSALEKGHLTRPATCAACGKPPEPDRYGRRVVQAHHHDYSRPLDVEWLCRVCHASEHRALGRKA